MTDTNSQPNDESPTVSGTNGIGRDLGRVACGFLMGAADTIPGVSGGTVALILGIYDRLVTAISHFDLALFGILRKRDWKAAAVHIDLRFLITLGCGILCGIGSLASLMNHLLSEHREATFSAFFGLILASIVLVGKQIPRWSIGTTTISVIGMVLAYLLVGLRTLVAPPTGNGYVFLCGMLAICAMILPGISGAFILLILGKYTDITSLPGEVLSGDRFSALLTLAAFGIGCGIGLLSFSKVIRWLLERHHAPTMALLCGFMAGSLRKIWPFKTDMTPEITKFKLKQFKNALPDQFDAQVWQCLALAVAGIAVVFFLDWITNRLSRSSELAAQDAD